jgi:SAM-dependent methyltransferase
MTDPRTAPPTRWELTVVGDKWDWYVDRFDRQYAEGVDLEGEARFVDVMAARESTILDGGCGTGRITAALHRMGHRVIGVDRDPGLIDIARQRYPGPSFLVSDLLLAPAALAAAGAPTRFDIIALPGNVMVYLAPGTERDVLRVLGGLLVPGGRLVAGFHTDRDYSVDALGADAVAGGLAVEHRFATWHLDPWTDDADWAVTVLRRPAGPDSTGA